MSDLGKSRSRREGIRKNRPDATWPDWNGLRASGVLASLGIATAFFVVAWAILSMRQEVVPYRPGQWIPHDIVSRVDFNYRDKDLLAQTRWQRRESEPRVYRADPDAWTHLRRELLTLPDRVADPAASAPGQLPNPLGAVLDSGAVTALRQYATQKGNRDAYEQKVNAYVEALRNQLGAGWTEVLSTHFETPHTIRVGWLSPVDLTAAEEVVNLPAGLSPV